MTTANISHTSFPDTKADEKTAFVFVLTLALLPVVAVVAPRFLAYGPALMGLGLYLQQGLCHKRWSVPHPLALFSVIGIVVMAGSSALWSIDAAESLQRTGKLCLVLIPAVLGLSTLTHLHRLSVERWLWLIPAGVAVCYALVYIELLWDMPLHRLLNGVEATERVNNAALNRPAVTATLCLFPALAILRQRHHIAEMGALALLAFLVFTLSQSQSAVLAFAGGLLLFFYAPVGRDWFWQALFLMTALLLLWSPLLAVNMLGLADTLENSALGNFFSHSYAAERLEIWSFIAQHILNHPWLGYGIEATRNIENFHAGQIYYRSTTVLHPHNFALQIWIEFGLLGAVGACLLLRLLLGKIKKAGAIMTMRFELATLYATMAVAAVGYGLWQGWWLGLITLLFYICALCRPARL